MNPQLQPMDKIVADKKFRFVFNVCLVALLGVGFFITGLFVLKPDFRMFCLIGSFIILFVALYAAIVMLIMKLDVVCHESMEHLDLEQTTNSEPDIEKSE